MNAPIDVTLQNGDAQLKAFARMLIEDKEMRARLKKSLRSVIKRARKNIANDIHSSLQNDPRKAYKSVKHSIYKSILGGNVSILSARKAGAKYKLLVERKLDQNPHQRGGNRRPRSQRTEQVDTYYGKDRGFILRFLNAGTDQRMTKYGNRGSIPAGNQFERSATWQMDNAAEEFANSMATEIEAAYEGK